MKSKYDISKMMGNIFPELTNKLKAFSNLLSILSIVVLSCSGFQSITCVSTVIQGISVYNQNNFQSWAEELSIWIMKFRVLAGFLWIFVFKIALHKKDVISRRKQRNKNRIEILQHSSTLTKIENNFKSQCEFHIIKRTPWVMLEWLSLHIYLQKYTTKSLYTDTFSSIKII